jgi:hypothetical protein
VRRVLLFAAFLLLLGLTTATAASFDVQAEDITSFSQAVTVTVPEPPLAGGTFYLVGAPANARLAAQEPTSTGGNEKASFDFGISDIRTEDGELQSGDKAHYVSWSSDPLPLGLRYDDQTVRVHLTRTGAAGGLLRAGLFACPPTADLATVTTSEPACTLLSDGVSGGETIDIAMADQRVSPGYQLRLKMVSASAESSSIQWGYKANNRSARLEVLP